jgi:beta-lactamase superfamily II metal-dependent hydrolase
VGIEIDFLAVGEEATSGDAIALRYGDLFGERREQRIVVIDGGNTESGHAVVDLVRNRYATDRIDLVVSSHPDQEHVGGLRIVIEELEVTELWMHQPWNHSAELDAARREGFAGAGFSDKLRESLNSASALESVATSRGVSIVEPFAGVVSDDGALIVVGPSVAYYEELLSELKLEQVSNFSLSGLFQKAADAVLGLVPETISHETLRDDGATQPQNNASVISLLTHEGQHHLFTGDAGIPAMENALDTLEAAGFTPGMLDFVQIPHHGSRRNVGPEVLDRLLGPKGQTQTHAAAFVSAARLGAPKHPAKKVTNAFRRRGYYVLATQGIPKWHSVNAPPRGDYGPVEPVPFYERVEDDED